MKINVAADHELNSNGFSGNYLIYFGVKNSEAM